MLKSTASGAAWVVSWLNFLAGTVLGYGLLGSYGWINHVPQ